MRRWDIAPAVDTGMADIDPAAKPKEGSISDGRARLPPPFWRMQYVALDVMSRRDCLDPVEISRVIRRPERRETQPDGRVRMWGYAPNLGGDLWIVLLSDRETAHNAFLDKDHA